MTETDTRKPAHSDASRPSVNPNPTEAGDRSGPGTGEGGGPDGPEPTRYGDWERNGRCIDF